MHEILIQKAQAIRHAIDGKARFEDVAEILKRVTGDVQLEIAKRIQLLPVIVPDLSLKALDFSPIVVPDVASHITLDERLDPAILQIPSLVKQLSLFGL
jgi:hypothetical protein